MRGGSCLQMQRDATLQVSQKKIKGYIYYGPSFVDDFVSFDRSSISAVVLFWLASAALGLLCSALLVVSKTKTSHRPPPRAPLWLLSARTVPEQSLKTLPGTHVTNTPAVYPLLIKQNHKVIANTVSVMSLTLSSVLIRVCERT